MGNRRIDGPAGGDRYFGVAYGNGAVQRFNGAAYFEVTMENVRTGNDDGLVLGVTTIPWNPKWNPNSQNFEVADGVKGGYSIGYYGAFRTPRQDVTDLPGSTWNPNTLRVKDKIGLLVTTAGEAHVLVNGEMRARVNGWPPSGTLYPFVDLLGTARAVSLNVGASPPGGCLPALLQAHDDCSTTASELGYVPSRSSTADPVLL